MKSKLSDSLKASLLEERKNVKSKDYDIEKRFEKAEAIFTNKEQDVLKNSEKNYKEIKSQKVIRDTFTLPERDYSLLEFCKDRALSFKFQINKSEIIRAGLIILNNLTDSEFLTSIKSVKKIKTGRPKT